MSIEKLPSGTRGGRTPPSVLNRLLTPLTVWFHHRTGNRMRGLGLVYLTTRGAQSGKLRTNPLGRFDVDGGWVVVASAAGAARQPGWYHNIVAHPDEVWAEVAGTRRHVQVRQLEGDERDDAWHRVTQRAPGYEKYLRKTDRTIPVLLLTRRADA